MPNTENINRLIEAIRTEERAAFNMNWWIIKKTGDEDIDDYAIPRELKDVIEAHPCGTVACIGGFCNLLVDEPNSYEAHKFDPNSYAAHKFLGIPREDADALFYPGDGQGSYQQELSKRAYAASPKDAIRVLEHLRDTGKVDWSIIMQPED